MDLKSLIEPIVALAEDAGRAILEVYSTDFEVQNKEDESPLTQADLASHRWIEAGLLSLTPDIPIISEESGLVGFDVRGQWQRYWLIDPLDGTKEFVNRNDQFTVNIALIENQRPVLGVVHVPLQLRAPRLQDSDVARDEPLEQVGGVASSHVYDTPPVQHDDHAVQEIPPLLPSKKT